MTTPTPPSILIRAMHVILRPLVRLLLEYGVTYPLLSNQLKNIFVDVVNEEMQVEGKRQTLSRISVVSGVHRKDVKRILEEPEDIDSVTKDASLSARILGIWLGDPTYLATDGTPLALPRLSDSENKPSFESLVASTNKDVRPRAILDEWLRTQVVTLTADDRVVLDPDSFVTEKNFDERVHFFARNLRDHIACGVHNLVPDCQDKFMERAVFYDGLSEESVVQLRALSRKLAMESLQAVNAEALRLAELDEAKENTSHRMTYGCYYYQQDTQTDKD